MAVLLAGVAVGFIPLHASGGALIHSFIHSFMHAFSRARSCKFTSCRHTATSLMQLTVVGFATLLTLT